MGIADELTAKAQMALLDSAMDYVLKDPARNLSRLLAAADALDVAGAFSAQLDTARATVLDPTSVWHRFVLDLCAEVDGEVLKTWVRNFVATASLLGAKRQDEVRAEYGCNVPWAILIDPTSACNLRCTGCWAAEYGSRLNLTYEELDDVVRQANELGTYMFLFSGGEPLVRKRDILRLCEEHPDCMFSAFTNGTLIDEEFADAVLRVRNFIPAISVEGFEGETDFRRGEGVFAQVERAMEVLRSRRLPFGVSCCYTAKNAEVIGSEAYFDWMVGQGARFCWLFTYMPVGAHAVPELMVSAEQRAFMYRQVRAFRQTKPLFTMDFWNDGEYAGGCIAGGRVYLHINAAGDMEPCAFVHYSDSNIREKTLLEGLTAPLFQAYRRCQPFNCNHLRPCPVLDNPFEIVDMVQTSNARSTDLQSPEDAHDLAAKCIDAARRWEPVADELWCQNPKSRQPATPRF